MQTLRTSVTLGLGTVIAAVLGCDRHQIDQAVTDVVQEVARNKIALELGPVMIADAVGVSAPGGGPSSLRLLCDDAEWRLLSARLLPDLKLPITPLSIPDPAHPITTVRVQRSEK